MQEVWYIEETFYVSCECEGLVSLKNAYMGSFFLDPRDINP